MLVITYYTIVEKSIFFVSWNTVDKDFRKSWFIMEAMSCSKVGQRTIVMLTP